MHGHFHLSIEIQSTMELQDESEEARASSRLYVVTPLIIIMSRPCMHGARSLGIDKEANNDESSGPSEAKVKW